MVHMQSMRFVTQFAKIGLYNVQYMPCKNFVSTSLPQDAEHIQKCRVLVRMQNTYLKNTPI